ncbi:TPA: helix-turn-helix domain-containing protein [Enterobacter hormaechei subsp. xiangfangensis]|nr:helix-turn-helix domain-containing protein [Enterobacter hormaechei subsp. xiangfangensis]HAV1890553.1 helix-turn-helix domain-containing protein [Enterobacter hormaechei subsp. xiangfangensis]
MNIQEATEVVFYLMDWMEQRLDKPIGVNDLVARAGYSRTHLHRIFKLVLGCAPGAYIRTRRLNNVMHVLDTGKPVSSAFAQDEIQDKINSAKADLIYTIVDWIEGNLGERMSVEAIADRIGCSRGHLQKGFKEVTGMTPWDYISGRRLTECFYAIRDRQKRSIEDIAWDFGYESGQLLGVMFKKRFGIAPSECTCKTFDHKLLQHKLVRPQPKR